MKKNIDRDYTPENEKKLAKQFDDKIKSLERGDTFEIKKELDSFKNKIEKSIDEQDADEILKSIDNTIEKSNSVEKVIGNNVNSNFSKSSVKYFLDKNREDVVNENINKSSKDVEDYISGVPGFFGNRMRKIMSTEK